MTVLLVSVPAPIQSLWLNHFCNGFQLPIREIRYRPVSDAHGQALYRPHWRPSPQRLLLLAREGRFLGDMCFNQCVKNMQWSAAWYLSMQIGSTSEEDLTTFLVTRDVPLDVSSFCCFQKSMLVSLFFIPFQKLLYSCSSCFSLARKANLSYWQKSILV